MVSTKDLRDVFDDLTKRAGDAISDAKLSEMKIPDIEIGRKDTTPGFLYFGLGLAFGTLIGLVVAFLATPYNGEQARQKVAEQVEKVRAKQREEMHTNGGGAYTSPVTGSYERPV